MGPWTFMGLGEKTVRTQNYDTTAGRNSQEGGVVQLFIIHPFWVRRSEGCEIRLVPGYDVYDL